MRINHYFPNLTDQQIDQFNQLGDLYADWNNKINVISRKDIENLYERHVLHSLAIAKFIQFAPSTQVLDLGTGGGFPGIPLAILFPEVYFHCIDGTGKKIKVVQAVAESLGLQNVKAEQLRAENARKKTYDFVVTRAVATLDKLLMWSRPLLHPKGVHPYPNGLIALKGGRVKEERKSIHRGEYVEIEPIKTYFKEEFFEEKYVVYVQG